MISPFICGWLKIKFGLNKSLSSIDIIDITISFQGLGLCVLSLQSSLHSLKKHDCFEHKHNIYVPWEKIFWEDQRDLQAGTHASPSRIFCLWEPCLGRTPRFSSSPLGLFLCERLACLFLWPSNTQLQLLGLFEAPLHISDHADCRNTTPSVPHMHFLHKLHTYSHHTFWS